MESKIKWKKWKDHPEYGDYLVAIRQKYPWEENWEEFVEPACYDINEDRWIFENDWNEGQEYEYVGIVNLDDIPFPSGEML